MLQSSNSESKEEAKNKDPTNVETVDEKDEKVVKSGKKRLPSAGAGAQGRQVRQSYQRILKLGEGAYGKAVLVKGSETNDLLVIKYVDIAD